MEGVRKTLRKTLFGGAGSSACSASGLATTGGGDMKKINENDIVEIRERDIKIQQLSERLVSLESLYCQLLESSQVLDSQERAS